MISGLVLAATPAERFRFKIPEQSLSSALREFSKQAGVQLLYSSRVVDHDTRVSLDLHCTVTEGLARLLHGTGLEFIHDGRRSYAIRPVRAPAPTSASASVPTERVDGQRPTPAADAAWLDLEDLVLQEIIVTARRRDEPLHEIPFSVVVLGDNDIRMRSIDNVEQLDAGVPNVSITGTSFFGRQSGLFRMRGIPGVAVYVDGVVHSGSQGQLLNVIELERIELMRGPQGTLFGKNAIGGAIQYVSQRPRDEFSVRARAALGSFGRLDVIGNLDLPVSESLLTKVTAARLTRDGYLQSTTTDRRFGSQDDTVVRADLWWRPTQDFSGILRAEYIEQSNNGNPSTVWALNPVCPGDPLPPRFSGDVPNTACLYAAVGLPVDPQWVYGAREERRTASDYSGTDLFTTSKGVKTELSHALSDEWLLKSLGGFRRIESTGYADFDGTPYKLFDGQNYNEREEKSLELQLQYKGARLSGTAGLYYYSDVSWARRMNWIANDLHPRVDPALHRAAQEYVAGLRAQGIEVEFEPLVVDTLTRLTTEGWAAFGEWTYKLSERLSATAGVRYNRDNIAQAVYQPLHRLPERCCVPVLDVTPDGPAETSQSGKASFTNVSPRVSIQYQWRPEVMTYLTYSEGFGAGGFTGGGIPGAPNGGFASYGPELLANYEVGLRSDLFNRRLRLNVAAFHGQYDDIQVPEEVHPRFVTVSNAGAAEIRGVELDGTWALAESVLVNYAAAWLDTHYTDLGKASNIRPNSPFAYAPRHSFSLGAQYSRLIADKGMLTVRGDYGWQDDQVATLDVNTGSLIPAYGLLSARVSYRPLHGRWDLALSGTNLTDEYYRINGFFIPPDQMDNGTVGRPREWGLTLNYVLK